MQDIFKMLSVVLITFFSTIATSQDYKTYQIDHEIQLVEPTNGQSYDEVFKEIKSKTLKLQKINEDIVGYVYKHGYFEQPVAINKGRGFDYYLLKDLNHNYHPRGTPFLSDNSLNSFQGNSLLYGHNSQYDVLFSRIPLLKDQELFENAPPLIIYDAILDEFKIMKLFTFIHIVDGQEYIQLKDMTEEERVRYNEKLWERSIPKIDKPDLEGKDVFFIQTCTTPSLTSPDRDVVGYYLLETIPGL